MTITSLDKVLLDQLKDLYNAEHQLVKALPKMIKAASNITLKQAINRHLAETENQVKRLDNIAKILGVNLAGKKCKAMEGLIAEGSEVMEEGGSENLIDLLIIAAAQRIEHYEISAYGSARAFAETLEHSEIVDLLQETLNEEGAADRKLNDISEDELLPAIRDSAEAIEELAEMRTH
jgi:ferritin-like metal-binding protein YciE